MCPAHAGPPAAATLFIPAPKPKTKQFLPMLRLVFDTAALRRAKGAATHQPGATPRETKPE